MDNIPEHFRHRIQEAKEKQLEVLYLSNSLLTDDKDKLRKIPEEVFALKNLKGLNLSYNRISLLPESLSNLTNLSELNLGRNSLSSLPESLGNLTNLTKLYLSRNNLLSLPESLGNLTNLVLLDLRNNQLLYLPDFLSKLTNLITLDLRGIQLSYLPDFLSKLTSLTILYLSENQLLSLPESLGNLINLTQIDLRNNQLSSLPESFGKLINLNRLYLSKNQLMSLPDYFGNLTNLNTLYLKNNPLVEPPIDIVEQGIDGIRNYFQQLKEVGLDYSYEAKLLIVGEAGAGKTTLAKKIDNPDYQLQEQEKSTEGIEVIKYNFPILDKKGKIREFKVNIWDFGGQEIYHATHQFFLTKRSLYTLVADSRKEDTDFYYWLNMVETLSDNSPLLIIKNEKQDRKREINETALRGKFSNFEKTLATNLATNRGLEEILTDIKHYIQKLSHVGETLPKTWVKVRQTLENDDRNYISLQEYLDRVC